MRNFDAKRVSLARQRLWWSMAWDVYFTPRAERWLGSLAPTDRDRMTQRIDLLRRHGPAPDHSEDRHLVVDRALTASTAAFAPALRYRSRLPFGQGKWAGQYDSAFTQKTYVHAGDDDLRQGRAALARIHKIA